MRSSVFSNFIRPEAKTYSPGHLLELVDCGNPRLEEILKRWDSDAAQSNLAELLSRRCPECLGETLVTKGSEVVCRSCGLVVEDRPQLSMRLPFDTTFALEASVAFGRSLGGTLPSKDLYKIVSRNKIDLKTAGISQTDVEIIAGLLTKDDRQRTTKEAEQLIRKYLKNIRATHLRTYIETVESPQALKLKEEVSHLLKQYGLYGENYNEFNHRLANHIGLIAEKAARFIQVGRYALSSYRKLAAAIIVFATREYPRLNGLVEKVMKEERPDAPALGAIRCMLGCPWLHPRASGRSLERAIEKNRNKKRSSPRKAKS